MEYIAHRIAQSGKEQSMKAHLSAVAQIAEGFAASFGASQTAYRCGLLHDIGKYSDKFQRRVRGSSERVEHSTAGAMVALEKYRDIPAAFCIAGHHSGLPDLGTRFDDPQNSGTLMAKRKRELEDYSAYQTQISVPEAPVRAMGKTGPDRAEDMFYIRMLFSCLVDADYLDTEQFMQQTPLRLAGKVSWERLIERLDTEIEQKGWLNGKSGVNQERSRILRALLEAGKKEQQGLFSLTVPTGGGKTVASMAFALNHAKKHGLRRVIYVIPYTSIIEQTQDVLEGILGKENVIAHFANVDYGNEEDNGEDPRRLAAENWDAPIILTTAVQFFESLYSNRPSQCRKLHNIAQSVIIFDEAQMLPVPYLRPCIHAISQLVKSYGCSAMLCTATQPSLDRLFQAEVPQASIRELCPEPAKMYRVFRRVQYEYAGKLSDAELAAHINKSPQALCIVNRRKQAQEIFSQLTGEGCYHLSTTMYPIHRREIMKEIRQRIQEGKPCRVVSTSLIEAGVDVDFPTVFRALAGLDSIIQAGGRCNREGKKGLEESVVYFFDSEQEAPPGMAQNLSATRRVMQSHADIASPDAIRDYFEFLLYTLKDASQLDQKQVLEDLQSVRVPFAQINDRFRLIEQQESTIYIGVPRAQELLAKARRFGPSRRLMRELGQYAVGVYPQHYRKLVDSGAAEAIAENAAVLQDLSLYNDQMGLAFSVEEGQALFS